MSIHRPDLGNRCSSHVGEAFPPRCSDCDIATVNLSENRMARRLGFIPGSSCPLHAGYPRPCEACARIAATPE